MTSRPAAPESETPETDAVWDEVWRDEFIKSLPDTLYDHARSLERRLSLAQTEIKGHIKVVDELRVDLRRTKAELACAEENFHVTNQAYVKADVERTQAQSRIAELEKADHLPAVIHAKRCEERAERAEARITKLESLLKRSQILYLPMDLQAAIDAALKDRV